MQERRLVETERGRITVGWLVVQDLAMVLVLVLLPGLAGAAFSGVERRRDLAEVLLEVAIVLGKFAVFVAIMLLVGKKLIPAILHYVAHTGSRELFRLAVLVDRARRGLRRSRRCSASRSRSAPSSPA